MASHKDPQNMDLSSDESGVRKEPSKPSRSVASSIRGREDGLLEVDPSSSSNSNSHSESSGSRASNAAEADKNASKTASASSPKNNDCSNKSDLTETSSLRNSASAKNEDQVESSLQGAHLTAVASLRQPCDGGSNGAVVQNNIVKKECIAQAIAPEDNGESHASEEEVNICDVCGDLGQEKLLAVCSICGVGAEHIYCMRAKLDEVPDNWMCEDCVTAEKDGKQKKEDANGKAESMNTTMTELQRENGGSFARERVLGFKDEERGSIPNGEVKVDSRLSLERCENRSNTPSDDQRRSSRKRKAVSPQDCPQSKSVRAKTVSSRVSFPEIRRRPVNHSAIGVATNAGLRSTVDKSSTSERISSAYKLSADIGANLSRNDDPAMSYNPFNGTSRPSGATPQFPVFPLPYCIWQGRFKLQRNGGFSSFCDGIQAHLSRSGSQNTAALAPALSNKEILLEETSRSSVWAPHFTAKQAAAKNIHIYFFSKDPERHESVYKSLLQHMTMNDVCLKGRVGGFELLVFSSDKLEDGFQRWNGVSFLWGVFRDPKPSSSSGPKSSVCQERNACLNRAQIPQVLVESRLVNLYQTTTRTFEERPSLSRNGRHRESTAPDLELSLGVGGASASALVSRTSIMGKGPSLLTASRNFHDKEPLLSLSLSLPRPFLGGEASRAHPAMREGAEAERRRVDTTLSLWSYVG